MKRIVLLSLLFNIIIICQSRQPCYDNNNKPKKCIPEFGNTAYKRIFEATNTCGDPPIEYCIHNSQDSFRDPNLKDSQKCYICQANSHNVEYLTDYESNSVTNPTWWQSETMKQLLTYKNDPSQLDSVNLTINLGKTFEITYVRIRFQSPAPESFAIYKRTNKTSDWIPYQYYSASCEATYNLLSNELITRENEARALCSSESSDIIPLTGNSVVLSTLENKPSANNFDEAPNLKEWVKATDIRISLNRLNTFGDELVYGEDAQKSYFYAISDIAIGGRCECNGHANECLPDENGNLKCVCQHNTEGDDCEKCKPFFNDAAWRPATFTSGFECVACNCNGYSNECYYDHELYLSTGHGGHCTNCGDNRTGPNCGECKFGFYRTESSDDCIDCECDPTGSESLQCDPSGKCKCKPGVAGDKCDKCAPNHYDLTVTGCQQCTCDPAGSYDSPPKCDPINGICRCKPHVENKNCDKCKPGYFNLQESNIYGCFQCFCFGHSSECTGSTNHKVVSVSLPKESNLKLSNPDLKFVYDEETDTFMVKNEKNIQINEVVYLSLPDEFLGNKRLSYNGDLIIGIKLNNEHDIVRSNRIKDLVIENSHENLEMSTPITLSNNMQNYHFKLSNTFGWNPRFHIDKFQRLLSNITSIKLRLNYNSKIEDTIISNIVLQDAKVIDNININDEEIATFIEQCKCPEGYTGQFCDQCKSGYKRENPNLNSFSRCIPCTCNNHSATCDQMNGKCDCIHHTSGDNCEQCERGYYGNALSGTQGDCKKCPCPNNGPCAEIYNYHENKNEVVCLECPTGTQGNLCESCEDGYFMKDPSKAECELCNCNGNIDLNAIGNCDPTNGNCLRCIYNTTGIQCEKCLTGYWGDALTPLKCHACECYGPGTVENINLNANLDDVQCDLKNGQCNCKPNVIGRQCNECENGYWNITSGNGCIDCKCDMLGAYNKTCDVKSGQCYCKPGVTGLKCDQCLPSYYGLTDSGCKSCMCDPIGSENANCDQLGRCKCRKNVSGMKCDTCDENKYDFKSGCLDCDDCYNLVQRKHKTIKNKIVSIESTLSALNKTNNEEATNKIKALVEKLENLKNQVNGLHKKAFQDQMLSATYNETVQFLENEIKNISVALLNLADKLLADFTNQTKIANDYYNSSITTLDQTRLLLNEFIELLNANKRKLEEIKSREHFVNTSSKNQNLKHLAEEARKLFEIKQNLVNDLEAKINASLVQAKKSVDDLKSLHDKIKQSLQISEKLDLLNLKNKIEQLISESETVKEGLEPKIKEVDDLIKKLDEFKLTEEYLKDINKLSAFIENAKKQQTELQTDLSNYIAELDKYLLFDLPKAHRNAETKFNEAKLNVNKLSDLSKQIENEKMKCDKALDNLNKTFYNASTMLETLKNFDAKIDQSKAEAEKAEELKPAILDNINKSRESVKQIQQQIHSFEYIKPYPIDFDTNKLQTIKENSNTLQKRSETLNTNTNKLDERVKNLPTRDSVNEKNSDLQSKFDSYNIKVTNHSDRIADLQNTTSKSSSKTSEIDKHISNYSIENITMASIDELKKKFVTISELIDRTIANDDQKLENLRKAHEDVNRKISDSKQTIELLENQVKELEKLDKSIERKCYKEGHSTNEQSAPSF